VSITTSPSCGWIIVNTNTWIAIKSPSSESGTGPGLVRYTAAANPNPSARSGTIVIGGVPFNVSQLGAPCTYSLSPTNRHRHSRLHMDRVEHELLDHHYLGRQRHQQRSREILRRPELLPV